MKERDELATDEKAEARRKYQREYQRKRRAENPRYRARGGERHRAWALRFGMGSIGGYKRYKKYGLTPEAFGVLLGKQEGLCGICARPLHNGKGGINVDHNHVTGQVRGILCHHCNCSIGFLRESADVARRVAEYLNFYNG